MCCRFMICCCVVGAGTELVFFPAAILLFASHNTQVNSITRLLILGSTLALSSTAWSIPLSTVGGADTILAQTTLPNSGADTEVSWIEGVLGISLDESNYTQTSVTAGDWMQVDDNPSLFAFELAGPADWFLIKIGANSGSPSTHFLFNNETDLYYATIDLIAMGFSIRNISNIGKISHIGTVPAANVPEPQSLVLLGMGLGMLGLALSRRRTVAQNKKED
jgi:hypothetical protein